MMKGMKRGRWSLLLLILLGAAALASGTAYAYLTDRDSAVNQTVLGGNRIEVEEEFTPPEELEPGSVFSKAVRVKNTGRSDCYVRIKAVFSDSNAGQYCSMDWNTADFDYCADDGYYYYTQKVSSGELTEYLFTTVSVSPEAPSGALAELSILVYAESCQAAGFENYAAAWENYRRNQP